MRQTITPKAKASAKHPPTTATIESGVLCGSLADQKSAESGHHHLQESHQP